jgi:hypothetical protein
MDAHEGAPLLRWIIFPLLNLEWSLKILDTPALLDVPLSACSTV